MADYSCAESTILNTSGGRLRVSQFGGRVLEHGERFSIPGTVGAWLAANHPGIKARRLLKLFRDQVDAGLLAVTAIPTAPCGDTWNSSSSMFIPSA
jgi:hypothetical protein